MTKKLKKKINYERKINKILRCHFSDYEIGIWKLTPNPVLNMQTPRHWLDIGWENRLWKLVQNAEKHINNFTTN